MSESTQDTPASTRRDPWAVRKTVNEALKARDLPDLDEEEELEEEEASELEQGAQVDVFDFCHKLVEKGDVVTYSIFKNSSFIAKKNHPYSWDRLQQELGEGHYRVQAKSEITKRFLKQQSNFVAAPEVKETTAQTVAETIRASMPPKQDPFEEMSKMATLLKSLQPPPVQDNTGSTMLQVMQNMMQMQQASADKTTLLIMEMQKSTMSMIEKIGEANRAMVEKLESKISAAPAKEKGMDPMQLLQLVQNAESRGMKNYMMLEELAEKKAAKMSGGGGGDDDKDESMTDKLIKTALPLIASAASQPRPATPAQAPVRAAPVRPAVAPRRPGPAAPVAQVPPAPVANVPAKPPTVQPVKPVEVLPKGPTPKQPALPGKQAMLDAIMPNIGQKLLEASVVEEPKVTELRKQTALETKTIVNRMGAPLSHLLQSVKENDMIEIAVGVGLPEEAHPWLKGFYADLEVLARNDVRSAATAAAQPS